MANLHLVNFKLLNASPTGQVEFMIADAAERDRASKWVEARLSVGCGESVKLRALQLSALRELRTIVGNEIQRLESLRQENNDWDD